MIETTKDFLQKAGILACPFFQILQSFYINISYIWNFSFLAGSFINLNGFMQNEEVSESPESAVPD